MARPAHSGWWGLLGSVLLAGVATPASAAPQDANPNAERSERPPELSVVRVLPFEVLPSEDAQADRALRDLAHELDGQLVSAARDLGLRVNVSRGPETEARADEQLFGSAHASGELWISPTVGADGDHVRLRIVVARPDRKVLYSRVERTVLGDVPVRAMVMLRDLVTQATADLPGVRPADPSDGATARLAAAPPSDGRLTLALNATLFGGLVGFSIQRSSGSDDPRLLYPLLALGAGVGLGGSILVAEEWDVGVADAWYLSAGSWWPSAAGMLIYEGRIAQYRTEDGADEERWTYALVGGTTGLGLSALGLTLGKMSDGGAVLAHSGGGLGMLFGGLAEMGVEGDLDFVPKAGMGYGAAVGWASTSVMALHLEPTPSRILVMDLGAVLGALGGAALGSPLLFDEPTATQQRAWLGVTAGAAVAGGTIGLLWGDEEPRDSHEPVGPSRPPMWSVERPVLGVIGHSPSTPRAQPIYGVGVAGTLQ